MTRYAFAALALAVALSARAGVILQYQDDDRKLTTLQLEGKKLRSNSQGAGNDGKLTIFDGDKQVFYSVDDDTKTYRRIDQASGAEMASEMKAAMESAKARMTPEQRAQMEALMASRQPRTPESAPNEHTWKFERASGSQTVAGYSCDNYRILRDGKLESEACLVPWSAGAVKKDDLIALPEMGRFFEKTYSSMTGGSGRRSRSADWAMHFVETAPGFPAVMDRVDHAGKRTREMRLVKVERTPVPASQFAPPPGYREEKMGEGR